MKAIAFYKIVRTSHGKDTLPSWEQFLGVLKVKIGSSVIPRCFWNIACFNLALLMVKKDHIFV